MQVVRTTCVFEPHLLRGCFLALYTQLSYIPLHWKTVSFSRLLRSSRPNTWPWCRPCRLSCQQIRWGLRCQRNACAVMHLQRARPCCAPAWSERLPHASANRFVFLPCSPSLHQGGALLTAWAFLHTFGPMLGTKAVTVGALCTVLIAWQAAGVAGACRPHLRAAQPALTALARVPCKCGPMGCLLCCPRCTVWVSRSPATLALR